MTRLLNVRVAYAVISLGDVFTVAGAALSPRARSASGRTCRPFRPARPVGTDVLDSILEAAGFVVNTSTVATLAKARNSTVTSSDSLLRCMATCSTAFRPRTPVHPLTSRRRSSWRSSRNGYVTIDVIDHRFRIRLHISVYIDLKIQIKIILSPDWLKIFQKIFIPHWRPPLQGVPSTLTLRKHRFCSDFSSSQLGL